MTIGTVVVGSMGTLESIVFCDLWDYRTYGYSPLGLTTTVTLDIPPRPSHPGKTHGMRPRILIRIPDNRRPAAVFLTRVKSAHALTVVHSYKMEICAWGPMGTRGDPWGPWESWDPMGPMWPYGAHGAPWAHGPHGSHVWSNKLAHGAHVAS